MATPPSISLIIPTFNDAEHLRPGLLSALGQSVPPNEIIVIDDGSTRERARDALADLAREFSQVTVSRQENAGPSAARNRGIAHASGEWLAFLDADDSLRADCLERRLELAASGCVGVYGGFLSTKEGGEQNRSRFQPRSPQPFPAASIGRDMPGGLPLWILRADAVRKAGGLDPSLRIMEDFDLLLRIGRMGGLFAGENEPTYLRAIRAGSHSRASAWKTYRGSLAFLRKAARERYFPADELMRRYARSTTAFAYKTLKG